MRNSTIIVKNKPCKSCGRVGPIFSKGRCAQCAKVEDFGKRMEKVSEKIIQEEDLSGLIADADAIFSKYIRLRGADKNGLASCFTCDTCKHYTLLQNGHYLKRGHLFLRFDERNCKIQCANCNEIKHGNLAEYSKRLNELSPGLPDILKEEASIVFKPTRDEIRAVITEYTSKVRELKLKLNKP